MKLQENYEQSKINLGKVRAETRQKFEFLHSVLENVYKTIESEAKETDNELNNKKDKVEGQIRAIQAQRLELMNSLQAAYNTNTEIPANAKLQLLSLEVPDFDTEFCTYFLKSENNISTETIQSFFGTIEKTPVAKAFELNFKGKDEPMKGSFVSEKRNSDIRDDKKHHNKDERVDKGRGRGIRARGDNREEGIKQPRQVRDGEAKWLVENRFGK
jgi:hypothetical protein